MKEKTLLIAVFLILLLVAGSIYAVFFMGGGIRAGNGTPGGNGGPPPGEGSYSGNENYGGPPPKERALCITTTIRFSDGTMPKPVENIPDFYVFDDLEVVIDLGSEKIIRPGNVKKNNDKFYFGDTVTLSSPVSNYKKINSITFKAPGYREIQFKNIPIMPDNFAACPEVVISK